MIWAQPRHQKQLFSKRKVFGEIGKGAENNPDVNTGRGGFGAFNDRKVRREIERRKTKPVPHKPGKVRGRQGGGGTGELR